VPNKAGRIHSNGTVLPRLFVTGWLKRGPSGIIGTNRADSLETVQVLLEDLSTFSPARAPGLDGLLPILEGRSARVVSLVDWLAIDGAEVERGKKAGKPREKFTRIEEMISVLSHRDEKDLQEDTSNVQARESALQN
jgi:ferredoxin--NADP+ reductase